jgi:alanine dehydrogenase
MKIALLKENKNEYRVCLIPTDVKTLVSNKHEVVVTKDAGKAAGFSDREYLTAGAKIVGSNKEAISNSNVILKLSKPTGSEFKTISPNQLLISLFNLANNPKVLVRLLKMNQMALGLEAFQENGVFTLMIPNEQIKGRFGALLGAYNLSKLAKFGLGKIFATIDHNNNKAQFTIINASYAGLEAAKTVLGLGANLTVLENDEHLTKQIKDDHHLHTLAKLNNSKFEIIKADYTDLSKIVLTTDVLINTNSIPGSITAKRITQKMVNTMKQGSVIIDLAIDQGVAGDTEKKPSTFQKPFYIVEGVKHFAIENIPALFANSVSIAISNILTEKILKHLKGENILHVIKEHSTLLNAIVTYDGNLTNKIVADALHLDYKNIHNFLK